MAAVVIPTLFDGTALYTLRVDMSDVEYILTFKWNDRDGAWYFDLSDTSNDMIRAGIKVVLGWPLLSTISDRRRPPGDIIAVDTEDSGVEADINDLGMRVLLVYDDGEA